MNRKLLQSWRSGKRNRTSQHLMLSKSSRSNLTKLTQNEKQSIKRTKLMFPNWTKRTRRKFSDLNSSCRSRKSRTRLWTTKTLRNPKKKKPDCGKKHELKLKTKKRQLSKHKLPTKLRSTNKPSLKRKSRSKRKARPELKKSLESCQKYAAT